MATENQEKNPLALSDEDFLNMNGPVAEDSGEDTQAGDTVPAGQEDSLAGASTEIAGDAGSDQISGEPGADLVGDLPKEGEQAKAGSEGAPPIPSGSPAGTAPVEGEQKAGATESALPDYEGFYKQIMTPFKANGKTIELKDPAEAVQLMQMGANYTRKMQDMVPHRKVLTMLQNNGLMDESKLSFLIDLDKKNPEAIKKLIKDSGIDPLEIDTSTDPAYYEGNHRVSDEEVNFATALEELSSTPAGQETLQVIHTQWDQASKDVLWKHPETLAVIQAQRDVGIYDRIIAEVDRRRVLGSIPTGTPLLQAYKIVGDELTAADAFADLREKQQGTAPLVTSDPPGQEGTRPNPEPVATRVVAPKSQVANGDAASAASPTRAAPQKAQAFVNPLSMSDDEFLKQFDGRL